jgi:PAS domain S-box-containing protein
MVRELELESIVSQFVDSVILIDPNGDIIFFNEVARQNQLLANKDLREGTSLFQTVYSESKGLIKLLVNNVKTYLVPQTMDGMELKHPDGYSVYFDMTLSPIVNGERKLQQICVIARDVTSLRSKERKSSERLYELSSLIENANTMIFSVDGRGYITEWNNESISLTGYGKGDVLARRVEVFFNEDEKKILFDILEQVTSGRAVNNRMLRLRNQSGHTSTVLFNVTPKVNATGQVIGATFLGQDITELSEYRRSLEKKVEERTEKLKTALEKEKELVEIRNKFVSIASHEFKMPLASITSTVSALLAHKTIGQEGREKLESIDQQVRYMKATLEDVLDTAKTREAKIIARLRPLNIVMSLQTIITEVMAGTKFTHMVVTDFPQPTVLVASDDKLLRNIFINLLSNAIKFSPDQNEIFVSTATNQKFVTVVVKDFGIGISDQDLEAIFEPFHRGMNATEIPGTGLGLSIVKKAIETLGGEFSIDSKLGKYTEISVRFKLLKGDNIDPNI